MFVNTPYMDDMSNTSSWISDAFSSPFGSLVFMTSFLFTLASLRGASCSIWGRVAFTS